MRLGKDKYSNTV